MELTKEFLLQQQDALRAEVTQLERDIYAKDGAIQALAQLIIRIDEKENQDGSNKSNNNKLSSV